MSFNSGTFYPEHHCQKFQEKQRDNICFLQSTRTSTDPLIWLSIGNSTVNNGNATSHHKRCQLVNLAHIQQEIVDLRLSFTVMINTLTQPMPTIHPEPSMFPRTTTPATMEDNKNPHHGNCVDDATCHHETQQLVDLLTLQWEIHQTMTSIQLFFDLLCSPPAKQHHNCMVAIKQMTQAFFTSLQPSLNNIDSTKDQSNGCSTLTELMTDSMMTMPMTQCPVVTNCNTHKYHTLCAYLSSIHTPAYFIPAHLLCHSASVGSTLPWLPTQQLMPMTTLPMSQGHKTTRKTLAQHLPSPVPPIPSMDFPSWLPIDSMLPAHLDCPPNGSTIVHSSLISFVHPNGSTPKSPHSNQMPGPAISIFPIWQSTATIYEHNNTPQICSTCHLHPSACALVILSPDLKPP